MKKSLQKIILKASTNFVFAAFLIIAVLVAVFYAFLGRPAEKALVEQMLHRTQQNARVGTASIESFFELTGRFMIIFSRNDSVVTPDSSTDVLLKDVLSQWEDSPVTSILVLDEDGVVINAAYRDVQGETGILLADREYFMWAKNAQPSEYYVSRAIESRLRGMDYFVVPVASPIFDDQGNFKGALVIGVSMDRLSEQYLNYLKISDKSEIYILRSDGTFLYTPNKELLGNTMFSFITEHPFLGSEVLLKKLEEFFANAGEGKVQIAYPQEVGAKFPLKTRLLAYTPLELGGIKWFLVISTPKDDVLVDVSHVYFNMAAILVVIFLVVLAILVRFSKMKGHSEGVEQEHKKHEIKDGDNG